MEAKRREARVAVAEALAVFAAVLFYIWRLRQIHTLLWAPILAFVAASHFARGETPQRLGFRLSGLKGSFAAVLPALLVLAVVLLAAGAALETIHRFTPERNLYNLVRYLAWGFFQQYMLNGYFVNRLSGLGGWNSISLVSALLFAAVHLPNPFLVVVTLAGGYVCVLIYLRHRNLVLLGLLHGIVGFLLHLVIPASVTGGFLVGPGYLAR